eukprot:15352528-Ditylum_brightwellii.AAC.1
MDLQRSIEYMRAMKQKISWSWSLQSTTWKAALILVFVILTQMKAILKFLPVSITSSNCFVPDDATMACTWFGKDYSVFEKYEANHAVHKIANSKHDQTHVV